MIRGEEEGAEGKQGAVLTQMGKDQEEGTQEEEGGRSYRSVRTVGRQAKGSI